MGTFDGSGVLGMLGENPIPQGTPDELRKVGVDPEKVGSCAPRSPGVRGCALWGECVFGQARYGGFKTHGPQNVGYYLRTLEGTQKQDFMTCHGFIRSLVRRMRAGDVAREEGNPHEQIRIIAQEGEWITQNPAIQVNPADKSPTAEWKRDPRRIQVPKHPRPGENPQITYDQQLWAEEEVRRKYDPEFLGAAPTLMPDGEPNEPVGFHDDDEGVIEFGATAAKVDAVAEPVSKKAK